MEILKYPHPALFKKAQEVTVFGTELKILLDKMWDTMKEAKGIGLAANQVGIVYDMFVMESPSGSRLYLVNPVIKNRSIVPANIKEGCLSAPGEFVVLSERASWVAVDYQDETGRVRHVVLKDIHAVCAQHEIDHLEGKSHLQSKSLTKKTRITLAKKWGLKV